MLRCIRLTAHRFDCDTSRAEIRAENPRLNRPPQNVGSGRPRYRDCALTLITLLIRSDERSALSRNLKTSRQPAGLLSQKARLGSRPSAPCLSPCGALLYHERTLLHYRGARELDLMISPHFVSSSRRPLAIRSGISTANHGPICSSGAHIHVESSQNASSFHMAVERAPQAPSHEQCQNAARCAPRVAGSASRGRSCRRGTSSLSYRRARAVQAPVVLAGTRLVDRTRGRTRTSSSRACAKLCPSTASRSGSTRW